jgi:hypothetical protein
MAIQKSILSDVSSEVVQIGLLWPKNEAIDGLQDPIEIRRCTFNGVT